MFGISFDADITALERELPKWALDRVPSITRNALNDIAKAGRAAEIEAIKAAFDRPTNYVANSPLYEKATKENLSAAVFVRDQSTRGGAPPSKILQAEVFGGARRAKSFELLLRKAGVMRADEFAVPARDLPRDSYGNVPRSLILRLLNRVGRPRVKGVRYFTPRPGANGGLARGIWEEDGMRALRPLILFVSNKPTYRRRYPFGTVTAREADRLFVPLWTKYFNFELAKAIQPR